jgi:hypothetical protein
MFSTTGVTILIILVTSDLFECQHISQDICQKQIL